MSPGREQRSSTSEEGRSRKFVRPAYGVPARERFSFCWFGKKKRMLSFFCFQPDPSKTIGCFYIKDNPCYNDTHKSRSSFDHRKWLFVPFRWRVTFPQEIFVLPAHLVVETARLPRRREAKSEPSKRASTTISSNVLENRLEQTIKKNESSCHTSGEKRNALLSTEPGAERALGSFCGSCSPLSCETLFPYLPRSWKKNKDKNACTQI